MEILTAAETSYDRLGSLASNIGPGQLDAATSLPAGTSGRCSTTPSASSQP